MKRRDVPSRGKLGDKVGGKNYYGDHLHEYFVPANPGTARQRERREDFGYYSTAWGTLLTEAQRLAWIASGAKVKRRDSLGNLYTLTGQALFAAINSARACIGKSMLLDPPEPVRFHLSPVEKLIISQAGRRLTLKLSVRGPVTEDIMVFGQAPCSPGRMKCRRVTYLGLLPQPKGGFSEITKMYVAVFGVPPAGSKVYIRTRWQVNGWEGPDLDTSAIVAAEPEPATGRKRG